MNRTFLLISLLMVCASSHAQHQACLVQIEKFSDVNKLSCTAGDYVTFWNDSKSTKGALAVRAVMMHACDLSMPHQAGGSVTTPDLQMASCTLREIQIDVIADDDRSKAGIE
jgi:hypothetical protein